MNIEEYKKVNKILHERIKTLTKTANRLYRKIRELKKSSDNEVNSK